jgi:hypothetical protein
MAKLSGNKPSNTGRAQFEELRRSMQRVAFQRMQNVPPKKLADIRLSRLVLPREDSKLRESDS